MTEIEKLSPVDRGLLDRMLSYYLSHVIQEIPESVQRKALERAWYRIWAATSQRGIP